MENEDVIYTHALVHGAEKPPAAARDEIKWEGGEVTGHLWCEAPSGEVAEEVLQWW